MSVRFAPVVIAGVATAAVAAPPHLFELTPPTTRPSAGAASGSAADNPFYEDFNSYVAGSGIAGQGPWSLWDPAAVDAWVDDQIAYLTPHSLRLEAGSDVVTPMEITSGIWELRVRTWFPPGDPGVGYVIGLNTWSFPAGPYHWSMDIRFDGAAGTVGLWPDPNPPPALPLITGQWVELVVEIDLDRDLYNLWYGGQHMVVDRPWSTGYTTSGQPMVRIQAFDWYSDTVSGMRFDDISFEEIVGCYANCDGASSEPILTVDDFTCFINEFAVAQTLPVQQQITHYANCDGSSTEPVLTVDDFTCFINAFAQGCP